MKIRLPGAIFATSLNFFGLSPKDENQKIQTAPDTIWISPTGEATDPVLSGIASDCPIQSAGESLSIGNIIPAERVWDRAAQRRFQELAIKEAVQSITKEEGVELENLSNLRRRETAPHFTAEEMAAELRQWQSMNRAVRALQKYVEEISVNQRA